MNPNDEIEFFKQLQHSNSELFLKLAKTYEPDTRHVSRETIGAKLGRDFMELTNTSHVHLSVYSSLMQGTDVYRVLANLANDRKRIEKDLSNIAKALAEAKLELYKLQHATKGK